MLLCLLALAACSGQRSEPSVAGADEPANDPILGDADFHAMGTPMLGDWLAEFDEAGQTYEQWVKAAPNWPNARRRTIYIQPVGELGPGAPDLAVLARYAELYFGLPVRVLPGSDLARVGARQRENPTGGQRQLHAGDVLAWIQRWIPDDAYAVIALTAVDLYPDDAWNFVFGLGSFKERAGVYSLARYHPSFYDPTRDDVPGGDAVVLRRAFKVMAHEIGHMFGIRHCTHYECVMNGTNSLGETDRRPVHMCPLELRKLRAAVGVDLRARYRELAAFYAAHGLHAEASFSAQRAER